MLNQNFVSIGTHIDATGSFAFITEPTENSRRIPGMYDII